MRSRRNDLHKAKLRRERIRREKHAQRAGTPRGAGSGPAPAPYQPFATERSLREIQAVWRGTSSTMLMRFNAHLAELTRGGRISEIAGAWKRDDPKWRAQELAYDALETDDIVEALRLVTEPQELDPDCIDAQRLMVSLLPAELDNRTHLMREVVDKAERNLGETFFTEHTGHFWGTVATRPYMRAKQHLGELYAESGRLEEAIAVFERMLELNPNDNQGMRYPLLGLYLATKQPERVTVLMSSFPDEESCMGSFAWARVMERWLSGQFTKAEEAMARARKVNRFMEPYLSGVRELTGEDPAYFRPGEESEAQVSARNLAIAWKSHPAFCDWLRAQRPTG